MIPKIEKILYATDLSQNSEYIFSFTMNLAIRNDACIIVLYVKEPANNAVNGILSSPAYEEQKVKTMGKNFSLFTGQIKEKLDKFCRQEFKGNPDADNRLEAVCIDEGYPADIILEKADALDCDVFVMGSHGKGVITQTFLGSVSRRVLRGTRKPVFIIPMPKKETGSRRDDISYKAS